MKQLDKLMAKSFVGPFVVTFAIALFVLLMQILWLYLDDIAGKGLSFFLIMELLAYKCVGLVPLALPLALLISSVMVLGNLAEHYELSSFKSSGVSLLRVIRMMIIFGATGALVSYLCSDYVIPAANLQFGARMYDIQQKKPTLNMEPGVFNEDFNQFTIRLGGRSDDGREISDVLIYDHTKANVGELSQITATEGEMYTADGGAAFVMQLYDGHQYVEQRPGGRNGQSLPFMRTSFATYTKVFDLSEFLLERHAASLFSTNRSMLSTWQLQQGVDSIDLDIAVRKQGLSNHLIAYLPSLPRDTVQYRPPVRSRAYDIDFVAQDSLQRATTEATLAAQAADSIANATVATYRPAEAAPPGGDRPDNGGATEQKRRKEAKTLAQTRQNNRLQSAQEHALVTGASDWKGIESLVDSLPSDDRERVYNRARSSIRSVTGQAQSTIRLLPGIQESRVKHIYDMHMKYSMAVVCIIFVFIGAPMGAIVRKGGFGYPILVSIVFFVIFIILTIFCRKLAESFVVNGVFAGWLPCIILFPVSLWITYSAMNDAKLLDLDLAKDAFRRARDHKQVVALRRMIAKS
ncbi:lipopolysaccharide export system permease protein [Neolewinella xylanilytica]|uniref:Lipopolysaccharide export system permease protein n=1 Tax=Neolewinella xylanilytica TaxID=1514080 RepID=A0A2S6I6C1_9BACT|nr:LptF/LptG family permease [Neolewinella xylanilytica]PPK86708.1 lipopolysaccharide export system permease protein [Neolewinella xylanilytica]